MYEAKYVAKKLYSLVEIIYDIYRKACSVKGDVPTSMEEMSLTEEEFNKFIDDERVNACLDDLEVSTGNRVGLFEIFDVDNSGGVSMAELLGMIAKVRGEPQKSDMIASWLLMRALHDKFDNFESVFL